MSKTIRKKWHYLKQNEFDMIKVLLTTDLSKKMISGITGRAEGTITAISRTETLEEYHKYVNDKRRSYDKPKVNNANTIEQIVAINEDPIFDRLDLDEVNFKLTVILNKLDILEEIVRDKRVRNIFGLK